MICQRDSLGVRRTTKAQDRTIEKHINHKTPLQQKTRKHTNNQQAKKTRQNTHMYIYIYIYMIYPYRTKTSNTEKKT